MGAFNLKSKTVLAAIGAILLVVGDFLKVGLFDLGAIINLLQASLPFIVAIFLRHGVSKLEKN